MFAEPIRGVTVQWKGVSRVQQFCKQGEAAWLPRRLEKNDW